jgi:Glycosyltransferase Family 4
VSELVGAPSRQRTPEPVFAGWLGRRLSPADLVHAHMVGARWAAAQAAPPDVPLVASEHNEMSWPGGDYTAQAPEAARRVDLMFTHAPAVRDWAAGLGRGARRWRACPPGHGRG